MPVEVLAWKPGSPYSTAIKANGFLFVSGSVPLDPATGALVGETTLDQTRQVLTNLKGIVEGAGVPLTNVVKVTVYLTNMDDFAAMNGVYKEFFPQNPPTRTTVGISSLARAEFLVEIDLIAAL
jgi:2-iminobutanoate/2-iminopropanoate deaminase